jgi:23S rRNA pseudouridine1911/1915/1917 synthase
MEKHSIVVVEGKERLDKFISNHIEGLSRSQAQKLIESGHVLIDGKVCTARSKTYVEAVVEVTIPEAKEVSIEPEDMNLDVVYEDDDLIVINKANGIVVHPAPGHPSNTLVNGLLHHCQGNLSGINGEIRPGIVHRIDKDTTGLLVVAKNDEAHRSLSEQLKDHTLGRTYYALVHGNIKHRTGEIDAPIGRDPKDRKRMTVTAKNSKEAVTYFEVIESFKDFTLVKCKLKTGRTHQIRAHFRYIGHPLVGDETYGPKKVIGDTGQMLHAKEISFIHPRTNEEVSLSCDLPDFFEKQIEEFREL